MVARASTIKIGRRGSVAGAVNKGCGSATLVLGQSMKTLNKLVAVLSLLLGPNERKEMATSKLRSVLFFSNFVAHFCFALSRSALRFAARARHSRDWGGTVFCNLCSCHLVTNTVLYLQLISENINIQQLSGKQF